MIADEALKAVDNATYAAAHQEYEQLIAWRVYRMRGYQGSGGLDSEDMMNIARIAMCEALYTYDGRGKKTTWVRIRIDQRLIDAIRCENILPRKEFDAKVQYKKGTLKNGRSYPTRIKIPFDAYPVAATNNPIRYDGKRVSFSGSDDGKQLYDYIPDYTNDDPEQILDEKKKAEILLKVSKQVLRERERQFLLMYLRDKMSQKEIGHHYQVSEARVCQIVGAAVRKMKAHMDEESKSEHMS